MYISQINILNVFKGDILRVYSNSKEHMNIFIDNKQID